MGTHPELRPELWSHWTRLLHQRANTAKTNSTKDAKHTSASSAFAGQRLGVVSIHFAKNLPFTISRGANA